MQAEFHHTIQAWEQQLRRSQFVRPENYRYAYNHILAAKAEQRLIARLAALGYTATATTHKCPFDLFVDNCRVELKAARWHRSGKPRRGRYQCDIRNAGDHYDLLIVGLLNGGWHWLVIPAPDVATRSITIRTEDIRQYSGKYAPYVDAWRNLAAAVEVAADRPRQLSLAEVLQ